MNAVAILERQLDPLAPRFEQVLAGLMTVPRLIQSVLISIERTPQLAQCTPDSILRCTMSAACLGLPIDGVTGQLFMIPFKDHGTPKAQLVVGYSGYNTLAARGDYTIVGGVIREGDPIDYEKGSGGFVRHKPLLTGAGRIIGAYAVAKHRARPDIVEVMGLEEILEIKKRSPGAKRGESPWNDANGPGFAAMAEKTPKRRLRRSLPFDTLPMHAYHNAARMDETFEERGKAAWITPEKGLQVDGEGTAETILGRAESLPYEASETPTMEALTGATIGGPANVDLLLATAKSKAKEGEAAFRPWYAGLTAPEQAAVDKIRKPAKGGQKTQKEDVI